MAFLIVIGLIIVVLAAVAVIGYNRFVALTRNVDESWSGIDVQLKRRHDLIPNLIETVKGYAAHERTVFENVTAARAKAISAGNPKEKIEAENALSGALKTLFAVAENYPVLRASENFLELQKELADTENKIQASRQFYNSNVRELNIAVEQLPWNIIASMFHFGKREFFEITSAEEREVPKAKF